MGGLDFVIVYDLDFEVRIGAPGQQPGGVLYHLNDFFKSAPLSEEPVDLRYIDGPPVAASRHARMEQHSLSMETTMRRDEAL